MILSPRFDLFLILSVGLWATLLAFGIEAAFVIENFSSVYWLLLVVGIDVSHVYSTLFRTYLSTEGLREYKKPLIFIPLICFIFSFGLALYSLAAFWRVLVYVAVFHFIRQQAGFVRIYNKGKFTIDELMIYFVTVGSVALWHLSPHKNFQWFVKGDFFELGAFAAHAPILEKFFLLVFGGYLVFRIFKLGLRGYQSFILVLSTFTAWYFGIVKSDSDFIFTMTNVLTHGLPYLALVWATQKKENTNFSEIYVFGFILLVVAFIEEGFWDALIWREHSSFFSGFYFMEELTDSNFAVALALALLILPQLTHYVLDGFIWKSKGLKRSWTG